VPLDEPLPMAVLKREIPDARIWRGTPLNWDRLERSGVHIHDDTADAIERLWVAHLAAYHDRQRADDAVLAAIPHHA
jgi:hypothetical protein